MTKKVLLIDVDSTIPNIALMKYSTYYKSIGYEVGFNIADPDIVVASIIFDYNKFKATSWKFFYPNAEFIIGGPGYDPTIRLPPEVEMCDLDYSLYPHYTDSIGRVTIGCPRKCYFCKVPEMGGLRYIKPVSEQYRGGVMRLLDDNILASRKVWRETADWFKQTKTVSEFDALDVRLMNSEIAEDLHDIACVSRFRFAFDITAYEEKIRAGHKFLMDARLSISKILYYIYLHDEANIPDAMYRCSIVKEEFKCMPFIMINQSVPLTPWLKKIKKRGCSPGLTGILSTEQIFSKKDVYFRGRYV